MRRPRYTLLVDKAIEAAISAIEIYHKPSFRYREETFSIVMLNAWELLLKARNVTSVTQSKIEPSSASSLPKTGIFQVSTRDFP